MSNLWRFKRGEFWHSFWTEYPPELLLLVAQESRQIDIPSPSQLVWGPSSFSRDNREWEPRSISTQHKRTREHKRKCNNAGTSVSHEQQENSKQKNSQILHRKPESSTSSKLTLCQNTRSDGWPSELQSWPQVAFTKNFEESSESLIHAIWQTKRKLKELAFFNLIIQISTNLLTYKRDPTPSSFESAFTSTSNLPKKQEETLMLATMFLSFLPFEKIRYQRKKTYQCSIPCKAPPTLPQRPSILPW